MIVPALGAYPAPGIGTRATSRGGDVASKRVRVSLALERALEASGDTAGGAVEKGVKALRETKPDPLRLRGHSTKVYVAGLPGSIWSILGWKILLDGSLRKSSRASFLDELPDTWRRMARESLLRECIAAGLGFVPRADSATAQGTRAVAPLRYKFPDSNFAVLPMPHTSGYVDLRYIGDDTVELHVSDAMGMGRKRRVVLQPGDVHTFPESDAGVLLAADPPRFEHIELHDLRPVRSTRSFAEDVAAKRARLRPSEPEVVRLRLLSVTAPQGDGTYSAGVPTPGGGAETITWRIGDVHPVPRAVAVDWIVRQQEADERNEPGLAPAHFEVIGDDDEPPVLDVNDSLRRPSPWRI